MPTTTMRDEVEDLTRRLVQADLPVEAVFDRTGAAPPKPVKKCDNLRAGERVATASGIIGQLVGLDDMGRAQMLSKWFGAQRVVTVRDARGLAAE